MSRIFVSICDLPNTLISKNWIPMANDFSSEGTDLKLTGKEINESQFLHSLLVYCVILEYNTILDNYSSTF